jgi:S1-C subfamily serine protease
VAWRAKRSSLAPVATTTVCPECKVAGPAKLIAGQVCAQCEAQRAWSTIGDAPLVIDHKTVDDAIKRRQGEAAGEPWWKRSAAWLPPIVTLGLAAVAAWSLLGLFSSRTIGSLDSLLSDLAASTRKATLIGLATVVAGVVALIRTRRNRHFRRVPILVSHLLAIVVGVSALVVGGFQWIGSGGFGGQYTSMPARTPSAVASPVERVLDATVVVLAPGGDGDARSLAMGTGSVVARDDRRAWIVTCSHVAMPYVAVGTFRHARDAQPVWVQLSDGREGQGHVRWAAPPPLDVALLEVPIAHAPEPVPIAADASAMQPSSPVTFVPNPYRRGWLVHHGTLIRREAHKTPAGAYDLLYTDLPVTYGDSGSGLFDARGQLVGLNTWTRVGDGASQGISLPSETMRSLVEAIHDNRLDQLDDAVPLPPRP